MGTGIKGFKSQKILKSKLKGYTEDQSIDYERYATIQELTGDKHGADVVIHGGFEIDGVLRTVLSGSNIRVLKLTAHGAQKGDFVRFNLSGIEASILSVPDVDTVILGSELSFDPTGLDVLICRHITPSYNLDGSLNVLASQGPVQFNKDGSIVEVNEDTVTPANNKALPVELMIQKDDGISYPVKLDTTNPYAHTPIPVTITDVTGTSNVNVNLTGSTLNVSIKHDSADPSSVKVGDGTRTVNTTTNNELKVSDNDLLTELKIKADPTEKQYVSVVGDLDPNNTTITALGANATFTGTWTNIVNYSAISLGIYADQNSATDGLKYQFSHDGVSVHHEHSYSYITDTYGTGYSVPVEFRYYRVVYTNGAVAQATLVISSTLKQTALFPSSYKVTQTISDQTQALFTRGVIVGESTAGGPNPPYVNVKVSPSGAVQVGGSVSVSNFPATQAVSGSVSVSNFPATQAVSGSVTVNTISGFATETTLSGISGNITTAALAAAQYTVSTLAKMINTVSVMVGWDGTTHRELSVDGTGKLNVNASVSQGYASGTVYTDQLSVGLTAVRATVSGSTPNTSRKKLKIKPSKNNTGAIYLGSSSVTTATGLEIIGPDRLDFDFDIGDYYLISDTAGQVVEVMELF